ncbi:MAG: hypothetical protein ACE14T_10135 [Syntrophales bacterium]
MNKKPLSREGTPHQQEDDEVHVASLMIAELREATKNAGPFHSAHEGYGVIKEEYDELWDEIKKKAINRDPGKLLHEAVQLGAMAMRFILDICMTEAWKR